MKRSIRVISLLLAVLLIALPPLQARAAIGTGTGILIGLAATAVVGSVMAGLGVMPGSDRSVFDGLVNDCIASPEVSPFLDGNNLIQVLRYTNGIGNVRYGVLRNLIEAVRGWLFSEDVVSSPPIFSNSWEISYWGSTKVVTSSDPFFPVVFNNSDGYLRCYLIFSPSSSSVSVYVNGTSLSPVSLSSLSSGYKAFLLTTISSSDSFSSNVPVFFGSLDDYSSYDWNSFSSSYDLSLGDVASQDDDLSTAYADWSAGSIALPHPGIDIPGTDEGTDEGTGEDTGEEEGEEEGEKKLVYWPTGIGGSLTDVGSDATTGALTQEGVISGVGTLDDTLTGALPGTIVGGLTGDVAIDTTVPGEGTEEGEGTGEGTVTYPTDIGSYALDLTDFFPFCIPFDIVDFLTLLAAEPEAPYFEFDINFPYMDAPWHVVIDLSAWDSIAALLRTLELLAFIIGLAVVTREKFLRG